MKLEEFNKFEKKRAKEELFACCGCTAWTESLIDHFPFGSIEDLKLISDKIWWACHKTEWLEAFSHHPKIGEKIESKKSHEKKLAWAKAEQSGMDDADADLLNELASLNIEYRNKFGFIFIICASGRTSDEMITHLRQRIKNEYDKELHIAATEQNKITHIRIDKLIS